MTALEILDVFSEFGVTHLVGIPDNDTAALFDAAQSDDRMSALIVTREGEAFSIAAGLWIGGSKPIVVIQNTGLLESGDAIRGTINRMGIPLLALIGFRGYAKVIQHGIDPLTHELSRDELTRCEVDTAGVLIEPTLKAWGIPFERCDADGLGDGIRSGFRQAESECKLIARLVTLRIEFASGISPMVGGET